VTKIQDTTEKQLQTVILEQNS